MNELFRRDYELDADIVRGLLQEALAGVASVTSHQLADSGDRVEFKTSFTWTSWGDEMVAVIEPRSGGRSAVVVSGEPRVGILSNPWGEELHSATIEGQLDAALTPLLESARTNPIMLLEADHRRVQALFSRIALAEGDRRAELVQQMVDALRTHMELEEALVYPLIQRDVDKDLAEEAGVEHQLARDGLDRLEGLSPDEPGFDGALAMVVAGVEHHVREEEAQTFPGLGAALSGEGLARLARDLLTARTGIVGGDTAARSSTRRKAEPRRAPAKRATDVHRAPGKGRRRPEIDLEQATKADLVELAKKAGIGGYSQMTKAELAKALTSA